MEIGLCPYCELYGLATTIKVSSGGCSVTGKCAVCGFAVVSEYCAHESADDLPFESALAVAAGAPA